MPKTKEKKVEKKVTPKPYSLKVKFNDVDFETKATSLERALKEFVDSKVFDVGVKTRVFLSFGDKTVTRNSIYPVPRARRLFRMMALKDEAIEVFANQLKRGLI